MDKGTETEISVVIGAGYVTIVMRFADGNEETRLSPANAREMGEGLIMAAAVSAGGMGGRVGLEGVEQ